MLRLIIPNFVKVFLRWALQPDPVEIKTTSKHVVPTLCAHPSFEEYARVGKFVFELQKDGYIVAMIKDGNVVLAFQVQNQIH